jgi:hypothetical protein
MTYPQPAPTLGNGICHRYQRAVSCAQVFGRRWCLRLFARE